MTADRSPDATADAAAVAGSGHLTDADREALADFMPWLPKVISTQLHPAVEAIVARAVNEALTEAADAIRNAEPTWHRGMYGCRDDMFTRRSLANLVHVIASRRT